MLVQHLTNLTNCDMYTVRWESWNVATQPWKIKERNYEVIAFVVNACMEVTTNAFYIQIQERSSFVRSICFI